MRNLLTDIPGIAVGHATDIATGTGATAILFDEGFTASAAILGGAPGSRATLAPGRLTAARCAPGESAVSEQAGLVAALAARETFT